MGGLSSLLVQDQVLSVTQIEQTLQRQVILGGDLPTILLELKMLDERVLVDYMSKVVGVPILPLDMYDDVDVSAGQFISKDTAVACKAIPVKKGDQLFVAVTGPLAMDSVQKLAEESHLPVTAQLVLEFRFSILMNQVYGVPLTARMTALQKKLIPDFLGRKSVEEPTKHGFERPTAEPTPTVALEAEVDKKISIIPSLTGTADATSKLYRNRDGDFKAGDLEEKVVAHKKPAFEGELPRRTPPRMDDIAAKIRLTAPPEDWTESKDAPTSLVPESPPAFDKSDGAAASVPTPESTTANAAAPEVKLELKREKRKLISYSEASTLLEEAENRDEIIETFFHFAHQAFDFSFLSVVHGEHASGRLATYRGGAFSDADFVSINLQAGGLFGKAFESGEFQIGSMDDQEGLNALNQLGLDVPLNATVIPVLLKNRVIMLLYGDSGHHGIRANRVERISDFTQLVSAAFERLLLAKKYRRFSSTIPPAISAPDSTHQEAIKVEAGQVAKPKRDFSAFVSAGEPFSSSPAATSQDSLAAPAHGTSPEPVAEPVQDNQDHKVTVQAPSPIGIHPSSYAEEVTSPTEVSSKVVSETVEEVEPDGFSAASKDKEPPRVSVSPSVTLRRSDDVDTTLKIHVETQRKFSSPPPKRNSPSVKVVAPIRVSRTPDDSTSASGAKSKAPAIGNNSSGRTGETDVRPQEESDKRSHNSTTSAGGAEKPVSLMPKPITADGRYMHVNKGDSHGEEQLIQKASRKFPVTQEMHALSQEPTMSENEPAPVPLEKKNKRSTARYSALSRAEVSDNGNAATGKQPIALSHAVGGAKTASIKELEPLVQQLLNGRFDDETAEKILAGGETAIGLLIANFPGPLSCDRFQEMGKLPKISYHGPLLRMLVLFGNKVVPFALPLLDSFDSEIRFYTTLLFSELGDADVLPPIAQRVFDNDRQIRMVAVDTISRHQGTIEYKEAVDNIAGVLVGSSTALEKKRVAAEVLGQLKEPTAIEHLAAMLGSVDGVLAERCQKSLVKITFRDFGFSEHRWSSWYEEQKYTHRLEWAIEAIIDKNEDIRRTAIDELKKTIGTRVEWPKPPYDFNQRRELYNRISTWWNSGGRELFPITLS